MWYVNIHVAFHHHVIIDCDHDASISQKVLHKFEKQSENSSFFMSCKSLLCTTLLNALFSFKLSSEITFLLISLHTMCIFSVISCKVVFVDLCLQTLIWMFNIKLHTSTTFYKRSNIMNFSILLSVLNSTIDLYIFVLK